MAGFRFGGCDFFRWVGGFVDGFDGGFRCLLGLFGIGFQ